MTRQELLAVVTYIHHFRQFLLGRQFVLKMNHGSLQWLHTFKEPEGQLTRWLERLQEYTFEIKHCKGYQHQNADAVSHYPSQAANELDATNPVDQSKHCSSVIVPVSVSPVNFPQFELAEWTP